MHESCHQTKPDMLRDSSLPRRQFLNAGLAAGALFGSADLKWMLGLPEVSAAEAQKPVKPVLLQPDIEPLARFLETTPRERLIEEMAEKIRGGVTYQQAFAALLSAGVRNVQPRPEVGFKFHAVLVTHSTHLASLSAAAQERWIPLLWAMDYFKRSQARDVAEGDWTMAEVDEAAVPDAPRAVEAFREAMETWDVEKTDVAVASLSRNVGAGRILDLFAHYACRDYRSIGHKAIFASNGWRALGVTGWRHREPILRSLGYALLAHEGGNPSQRDSDRDRPGRENLERVGRIRNDWMAGRTDNGATLSLLQTLRDANHATACEAVVEALNSGVGPQSIWDAVYGFAGELLLRAPGIVSLHALTSSNALHYLYTQVGSDATRRRLLLQNVAFLTMFRQKQYSTDAGAIENLEPTLDTNQAQSPFQTLGSDRAQACREALGWLSSSPESSTAFIQKARQLIFLKARDSHDYKFSSAALEDCHHLSPEWKNRFLAASLSHLKSETDDDNPVVERIKNALNT